MEIESKRMNKKGELKLMTLLGMGLLILLFSVSMISFTFSVHDENNSTHPIADDPVLNDTYNDFQDRISVANNNFTQTKAGFFSDIPIIGQIEGTVTAIFGVVPAMISQTTASYNLVMTYTTKQLGVPSYVLNMFTAFLTVAGILLAWRVYKAGS